MEAVDRPSSLSLGQGESQHQEIKPPVCVLGSIRSKSRRIRRNRQPKPLYVLLSLCASLRLCKQQPLCCIKYEMGVWNGRIFFSLLELSRQRFRIHDMDQHNGLQGTCKVKESKREKKERDRLRGKVNSFAKGTTLVIKFQAKSPVHHALSFASLLNMHEFILHEQAQCLHMRRHTRFARKKKGKEGNI